MAQQQSDEQSYVDLMMHKDLGKRFAYLCEQHGSLRETSRGFPCHQRKFLQLLDQANAGSNGL